MDAQALKGRTAVVTGASSGMGRWLAVLLSRRGCNVAACDVKREPLEETKRLCADGVRVTVHLCDVSDEAAVARFRAEVEAAHGETTALLFNNAGISGGMVGFLDMPKQHWDRVFNINLHGVVAVTRAFLPTIVKQRRGYVVNTSSVNGIWAALGPPGRPVHGPYVTSKFAVRGFSEALMLDMRAQHPHVGVAVVHPGHVGTQIAKSAVESGMMPVPSDDEMKRAVMFGRMHGEDWSTLSKEEIMARAGGLFEEKAPVSAQRAAEMILDGVASGSTRILVGEDARAIDWSVRISPRGVYTLPGSLVMMVWAGGANAIGAPLGVPLGRYWLPAAVAAAGAYAVRRYARL